MLEYSLLSSVFLLLSKLLFFFPLSSQECDPQGQWGPLVCVCMCRREGEKDRGSLGQGRGVKGGADPDRARGSRWQSSGWEGVDSHRGPGFNRDVRHDKDGPDRPAEWSCRDRAAILSIPYLALSTVDTPSPPSFFIHGISLVALTYFISFSPRCGSVRCVRVWCVCPHSHQGTVWIFTSRQVLDSFFFFSLFFFKDEP